MTCAPWTALARRRLHGLMSRRIPALVLIALLAASLAGCTAGSGTAGSSPGTPIPAPADGSKADGGGGDGGGGGSSSEDGSAGSGSAGDPSAPGGLGGLGGLGGRNAAEDAADRDIVTTGTVTLTVNDPVKAAQKATDVVEAAGGRVEGRTEQAATATDGGRATLTVRIPSSVFSAALDDLKGLGRVESVDLNATDVTAHREDLDARIRGLQTSVDRLLGLLASSADTDALLKVENALAERQTELESLQSERDSLADAVALTTVTVQLLSTGIAPDPEPGTFWTGVLAGFSSLLGALGVAAVALGVALPWLLFLAAVAVVLLLLARWILRRSARGARPGEATDPSGTPEFQPEGSPTDRGPA
jgi:hypothetical protein